MIKESVTFIVRAIGIEDDEEYSALIRCLKSIGRQTVENYRFIVFMNNNDYYKKTVEKYSKDNILAIKSGVSFSNEFNKIIKRIDTEYCMIVNYNETVAQELAKKIIESASDLTIFNLSRKKRNKAFINVYTNNNFSSLDTYLSGYLTIWNLAFKTGLLVDNEIKYYGASYPQQSLFAVSCAACAEKIKFSDTIAAYLERISKETDIPYSFFSKHRLEVKSVLKKFAKKGMNSERSQIIKKFVFSAYDAFLNEKSFVSKIKVYLILRKYIGL